MKRFIVVIISFCFLFSEVEDNIAKDATYDSYNLGIRFLSEGNYEKAIESFKKCIYQFPNNADAYRELGNVYKYKGNYSKSIGFYKKSIFLNPNSSEVYHMLGTVYHDQGNYNKAIPFYEKSIEINPQSSNSYFNLAIIYHNSDFRKAIHFYKKSAELGNLQVKSWLMNSSGIELDNIIGN